MGEGEGMEGKASCWSEHCCGMRNLGSAPAGADTAGAVRKYG